VNRSSSFSSSDLLVSDWCQSTTLYYSSISETQKRPGVRS